MWQSEIHLETVFMRSDSPTAVCWLRVADAVVTESSPCFRTEVQIRWHRLGLFVSFQGVLRGASGGLKLGVPRPVRPAGNSNGRNWGLLSEVLLFACAFFSFQSDPTVLYILYNILLLLARHTSMLVTTASSKLCSYAPSMSCPRRPCLGLPR